MIATKPTDANKALVQAHYDAMINRFDPDALRAQLAADFFDHQINAPMNADEAIAHGRRVHAAFANLKVTLDDMVAEGDRVAVRATWRGRHAGEFRGIAPTGRPASVATIAIVEFDRGAIASQRLHWDCASLASQLGVTITA